MKNGYILTALHGYIEVIHNFMSKKENISNERNNPGAEEGSVTIHPRNPGSHHKPEHKPSESAGNPFPDKSQDADRHSGTRHKDSQK